MNNEENRLDQGECDTYEFEYDDDVDPLELVGNASLSLHHHMAPPEEEVTMTQNDVPQEPND